MKYICAENLIQSIANDPEINGKNFAKVKRHIDRMTEVDCSPCFTCTRVKNPVNC